MVVEQISWSDLVAVVVGVEGHDVAVVVVVAEIVEQLQPLQQQLRQLLVADAVGANVADAVVADDGGVGVVGVDVAGGVETCWDGLVERWGYVVAAVEVAEVVAMLGHSIEEALEVLEFLQVLEQVVVDLIEISE